MEDFRDSRYLKNLLIKSVNVMTHDQNLGIWLMMILAPTVNEEWTVYYFEL